MTTTSKMANQSDVYAYRLKKNYQFIVRDLEPRQVLNYLYQEDVIDGDVRDEIRAERTRARRAEALLDRLGKRGSDAIQHFIVGLQNSSQKHLAEILNQPLANETSLSRSDVSRPGVDLKECYPMKRNPCGLAIIINNYKFDDKTKLDFREGSTKDAIEIDKLFKNLKFATVLKTNLKECEVKDVMRDYSMEDHTNYDCFVLFFMSHGTQNGVYSTDGKVLRIHEDITGKFNAEDCPTLANKPKLFFIQACRGRMAEVGVVVQDGPGPASVTNNSQPQTDSTMPQSAHQPMPETNTAQPLPETNTAQPGSTVPESGNPGALIGSLCARDTDIFIGFASSRKKAALRNTLHGGWFVSTLCGVIREHADREDLLSMMTKVNEKVNEKKKYPSEGEGDQILMQAPEVQYSLRKKVYFNTT